MNFPKFLRLIALPFSQNVKINSTTNIARKQLHPIDVEIASLLAKMYKFSYELALPSDGEMGRRLPNGNWTGMTDMLLCHEGDLVIGISTITLERMEALDFSFPILRSSVTFGTTKPEYSPEIKAFLKPFSAGLWISLVTFLMILRAILVAFHKGRWSYGKLLFATFRSLLGQYLGMSAEYFVIFFYIIGATFFIHSYTCVLLSFITFPTFTGVQTIPELADAVAVGRYQCVSYPGTFFAAYLSTSKDPNFRIIGENLKQNNASFDAFDVLKSSKVNGRQAWVGIMEGLRPFKTNYFISKDEFFPLLLSLSMRKDFCCREQVTLFSMYMSSSGLYEKIWDNFPFRKSLKFVFDNDEGNADQEVRRFSLKDLEGVFFVLCTGIYLSTAVFCLEMIFHRFSKNFYRSSDLSQTSVQGIPPLDR